MPGNVYWKDSNGRYLGCNENQANMLGIQSPEEIIGKTTNEIVRSDLSDAIIKTDQKVMNSQKPLVTEESVPNINHKASQYLSHKIPLINANGETYGLIGISIDISKQKKIKKDLTTAEEKAEESNKIKTDLILNLSHDLRTPCANILGLTNLLIEHNHSNDSKENILNIITCSNSLLSQLDQILEASQFDNYTNQHAINDY